MESTYVIYMHRSPSGKAYIGQTKHFKQRNKEHRLTPGCTAFAKAIRKHGWDSFEHIILEEGLTIEQANVREQELIAFHKTLAPHGYNLVSGGRNGVRSDETKRRMSDAQKGRVTSDSAKLKMAAAKVGKTLSKEHRAKLSQVRTGRVVSEETRAKIAASLKGKAFSDERVKNIRTGKQAQLLLAKQKKEAAQGDLFAAQEIS